MEYWSNSAAIIVLHQTGHMVPVVIINIIIKVFEHILEPNLLAISIHTIPGEIYSSVLIVPSLHVQLSFCAPRFQIPSDTSIVGGAIA